MKARCKTGDDEVLMKHRLLTQVALLCCVLTTNAAESSGKPDQTLGYVMSTYVYSFYLTKGGREECPNGFVHSNRANWEKQFPTQAQRLAHLERCGSLVNRGPECENAWVNPEVVKDSLPFRAVQGKKSYGFDLDGNSDGAATENTCAHENFVSPDGATGIDNQYYRFIGCEKFVHGGQHHADENAKTRMAQYQSNRVLLELSSVNDVRNDDAVVATLYRGKDSLVVDSTESAVAWQSQRVDSTIPPVRLTGKIVDGELITDPADVYWEGIAFERRLLIRGMSLRLKLDGVSAAGWRVGYVDAEQLWQSYSNTAKWGGNIYGASAPAAYEALYKLADGFKDPQTGKCTALSSARKFEFVRAHLIQPTPEAKP